MSCYHPLKAFIRGTKDNGKKDLVITSIEVDHLEVDSKRVWHVVNKHKQNGDARRIDEHILIPCGQCIGCRIDYSREWANRMMLEIESHKSASFITLTYDEEHVPLSQYVDENGEIQTSLTLRKRDFQLFMKRLRKAVEPFYIRFYACGEYGSTTARPHYHAIIYGYDFPDKKLWKTSRDGFPQFRSEMLERVWPFGHSMVCDVSWNTCAYVARYVTKKKKGFEKDFYTYFNIVPEFSLMSRRPGIGREYYDLHKDEIYQRCELYFKTMKGGIKSKPPRYFDKLYDIEEPEKMQVIKDARKRMSDNITYQKTKLTSKNLPELLEAEESYFESRTKLLRRDDV